MRLAETRDHFVCPFCGAHRWPESSRDGALILGEATGMKCPLCPGPLVTARLERAEISLCGLCHGFLIASRDLAATVESRRMDRELEPRPPMGETDEVESPWLPGSEALRARIPAAPITEAARRRRIACPKCRQTMEAHPYLGPGAVLIDRCAECGLVWMDPGELTRIERA